LFFEGIIVTEADLFSGHSGFNAGYCRIRHPDQMKQLAAQQTARKQEISATESRAESDFAA